MTDPTLIDLQNQVGDIDIPPVPYASVLRQGRQLRRRRRASTGIAGLAITAMVAGGVAWGAHLIDGSGSDTEGTVAAAVESDPVYAAGSIVVIGKLKVEVPHTVHDMVFTSEGVLVRSNRNGGNSDGSGPENLTLIRDDGSTTDLGVLTGDRVGPATDPDQPFYALAERSGTGFEAVIRDVRSGEEVKRVALPDQPMSYWDVPPLSLDGDQVYAGFKSSTWSVNWRTGEASQVPGSEGGAPQINAGKMVKHSDDEISVLDLESGKSVSVPADVKKFDYGDLSPDGRSLLVVGQDAIPETFTLYDLESGKSRKLASSDNGWWQWTLEGDALSVTKERIRVCSVQDGCADTEPVPGLKGELKPGGSRLES